MKQRNLFKWLGGLVLLALCLASFNPAYSARGSAEAGLAPLPATLTPVQAPARPPSEAGENYGLIIGASVLVVIVILGAWIGSRQPAPKNEEFR